MTKQRKKRIPIPWHKVPAIEAALKDARAAEWLANYPAAHWGVIYCPHGHAQCWMSVYGTPRVPESHARAILRKIAQCPGRP